MFGNIKNVIYLSLFLFPSIAVGAGGYIGPQWITYLGWLLLLSFPATFIYVGYLSFTEKTSSRRFFVWTYTFLFVLVSVAIISMIHLFTNDNEAWVENLFMATALAAPTLFGFLSWKVMLVVGNQQKLWLRRLWSLSFISLAISILTPFILMYFQTLFPNLRFFL